MPTLQAYSMSGKIYGWARWPITTFQNLHVEDIVQVSVNCKDKDLFLWLTKNQNSELSVDRENKESEEYSIIISFKILRFRHMIDTNLEKPALDSMGYVVPMNRNIEHLMDYLGGKPDPRFKNLVKKTALNASSNG